MIDNECGYAAALCLCVTQCEYTGGRGSYDTESAYNQTDMALALLRSRWTVFTSRVLLSGTNLL